MSDAAKQAKQVIIDEIKARFDESVSIVVVDYLGLTVAEADELRRNLREANVGFTVYKNTMVRRAIEGTEYEGLTDVLKGSSAFAFCKEDATASARVLKKAIKEFNKMEFKAGYVEGALYDKNAIEELASIPSREELIARFMGSIQSPMSQFVRTLAAIAEAAPAEAETPAEEAAPAEAEAPAEEVAPAEAEASVEEAAPAESEAPAEEAAPAEAEAPAEEPAPAEAEAPAEEAAPADDAEAPAE